MCHAWLACDDGLTASSGRCPDQWPLYHFQSLFLRAPGGGGGQRKQGGAREKPKTTHSVGESLKAVVVTTTAYGAFVRLPDGTEALLHVSEMAAPADTVSPQARDLVKPEDEIEVRHLSRLLTPLRASRTDGGTGIKCLQSSL